MSVRVFTLNEGNMIDTEIRDFISISVNDTYERISKTANISLNCSFLDNYARLICCAVNCG
jgi:hypothetical protein